ncbi:hypothetical protein [Caldimicrobium thiodismutans]|nr:hypothetical protein [Caldimicrobium thiodismutans]
MILKAKNNPIKPPRKTLKREKELNLLSLRKIRYNRAIMNREPPINKQK